MHNEVTHHDCDSTDIDIISWSIMSVPGWASMRIFRFFDVVEVNSIEGQRGAGV